LVFLEGLKLEQCPTEVLKWVSESATKSKEKGIRREARNERRSQEGDDAERESRRGERTGQGEFLRLLEEAHLES
jgi:hypothetical protein